MRILITGANGHLGTRLIDTLSVEHEVIAVVRSPRALAQIEGHRCQALVVDYADVDGLTAAARDCEVAVHLVGIIKKSRANSYDQAHEIPCRALSLATAKAGVKQIIAMSILGSDAGSTNLCLASRGKSETILLESTTPALIIRVPMVLGENDFASRALFKKARKAFSMDFRTSSLEQPIYAGDVIKAIDTALERRSCNEVVMLAGPEVISRRKLIERAGRVIGTKPRIISIPVVVGLVMGKVLEMLMQSPPVTSDMIDLLDHDDTVDAAKSASWFGFTLTSLDEMLKKVAAF